MRRPSWNIMSMILEMVALAALETMSRHETSDISISCPRGIVDVRVS